MNENRSEESPKLTLQEDSEEHSPEIVDAMFAESLSRGMQNAITSQQNAQMASSSSVSNVSARILSG